MRVVTVVFPNVLLPDMEFRSNPDGEFPLGLSLRFEPEVLPSCVLLFASEEELSLALPSEEELPPNILPQGISPP